MSNYNNYFNTIQNVEIDEAVVEATLYAGELNVAYIHIGPNAGDNNQGLNSIAIGGDAGLSNQGVNGIAIGSGAGQTGQGTNAIAIGVGAGQTGQGAYSIAIGTNSSATGANAIVLNASNLSVTGFTGGFFTAPIRNLNGSAAAALWYNASSKEICYGTLS